MFNFNVHNGFRSRLIASQWSNTYIIYFSYRTLSNLFMHKMQNIAKIPINFATVKLFKYCWELITHIKLNDKRVIQRCPFTFFFSLPPFYTKYITFHKRAKTCVAKLVVDTLYDRKVSRDRIVLQRIIDRSYISDGYFYFYFHDSWINYHEHRFDVPSLVIRGHSLMKKRYCTLKISVCSFRCTDSIVYVNLQLKNRASKSRCSREKKKKVFFFSGGEVSP